MPLSFVSSTTRETSGLTVWVPPISSFTWGSITAIQSLEWPEEESIAKTTRIMKTPGVKTTFLDAFKCTMSILEKSSAIRSSRLELNSWNATVIEMCQEEKNSVSQILKRLKNSLHVMKISLFTHKITVIWSTLRKILSLIAIVRRQD